MKATATHCEGAPLAARPKLSRAPALASRLAHLHPDASASPHAMLGVVLACGIACTTYELRPRPLSRHGESSECAKPASSAPLALRDKEEQPTSIVGALSSMGDPVSVRSTASLNSTRPSPMGGRLPSLSVLRVSAHPRNPGTRIEAPWRSADALCLLRACRLLHHSRAEGRQGGSRAPHGAACAERGVVERGGAVCSGDVAVLRRGEQWRVAL